MLTGCAAAISFRCEFILNMFQGSLHRSVILLNTSRFLSVLSVIRCVRCVLEKGH
jgi:hypothetical protein